MKYFRNYELARLMHVSQSTVGNWVSASLRGKADLQLYEQDGKHYIADTAKNLAVIEALVKERRKFLNTRSLKAVTPSPKFYERYKPEQVVDIIANLQTYRELPLQYSYFDGGAEHWDEYASRLYKDTAPNTLTRIVQQLDLSLAPIEHLIGTHKQVNVIDIGVGNGLPVKSFLAHLLDKGVLNRYIGIDDSDDMLAIARRNLTQWFDGRIKVETHSRDITREGFYDLVIKDYLARGPEIPLNIVVLFGGTLANLRAPDDTLRLINKCMAAGDLLLYSFKLDTPNSRRFFDVPFDTQFRMPLDLMNIDPSWYEVEPYFDEERKCRVIRIRLNLTVSITFDLAERKHVVEIGKDETILIWRARHQNVEDITVQFDRTGFNVLNLNKSRDNEYVLLVSEIKTT